MDQKIAVQRFWDKNSCGGEWADVGRLVEYRNKTEPQGIRILREATKHLDENSKVLEVGCGQGIELIQLAKHGINVIGVDYSLESVNQAIKNLSAVGLMNQVFQADAENLPFEDNYFDFIYSIGVLHHTSGTERAISEIHRVLKKGGKAVIMLYSSTSWKSPIVKIARSISFSIGDIVGDRYFVYNGLSKRIENNSLHGTTMLELFGCPILKMYSKPQIRKMFNMFSQIDVRKYSSNLGQVAYFIPVFKESLFRLFRKFDNTFDSSLGFYNYIFVTK